MDEKALGKRLQDARRRVGLTQQQLCQKAGLSYSTLAKIERGAIRSPSVFTVATIASITSTTVEDLLGIDRAISGAGNGKRTSKSGVKFVYFDLNGTLVHSYEKAFTKLSELSGLPVDTVEAAYWRYDNDICRGAMSMADFNSAMAQRLGLSNFDWTNYYLEAVEPVEGMSGLVDWVAEHYELGLLSGTMPGLIEGLASRNKFPLNKFSKVIDSSVVKMLKDSPQIFEYAQETSGFEPSSILLIDDDKVSLINADKLGWQICRFNAYDPAESIARVKKHLEF